MMKQPKRILFLVMALFLSAALLVPVQPFAARGEGDSFTILHATDLHHLSPTLTDYGLLFQRLMSLGDGKLTERTPELMEALKDAARAEKADVVVLTGDLTFNGEEVSLMEIAGAFQPLWDEGIPVLVIPGNHDIGSTVARFYTDAKGYGSVRGIDHNSFLDICRGLGWDQSLSHDRESLSYIYALGDKLWLLLLDANTDAGPGLLPDSTLVWLEEQLKTAAENGITVLSFSHQNLLEVNSRISYGFTLWNRDELYDLYTRYGVKWNFSGHSHLQKTLTEGAVTEVITGAVSVSPLHYGIIRVTGDEVSYGSRHIAGFEEEAEARFRVSSLRSQAKSLEQITAEDSVLALLADFGAEMNAAYFAGDDERLALLAEDPRMALWAQCGSGTAWYGYMLSMLE